MSEHEAARTLVKSPPELWEICSDPESLGRHLRPFGEIRITRVDPETTVAWEGDRASGTVRIEPSGWGTRVTLTARAVDAPEVAPPEPAEPAAGRDVVDPAPSERVPAEPPPAEAAVVAEPTAAETAPPRVARPGVFKRLARSLFRGWVAPVPVPEQAFDAQAPEAAAPEVPVTEVLVTEVLVTEVPVPDAGESEAGGAEVGGPEVGGHEDVPPTSAEPPDAPPPEGLNAAAPAPEQALEVDPPAALHAALSSLGQDHHRPFSRG